MNELITFPAIAGAIVTVATAIINRVQWSAKVKNLVALVLAVRQALLRQRLDQRLLAQAQKRPQHHPAAKRHACPHSAEPIRARAAQKAHQHRFGLIVPVVRHQYRIQLQRVHLPCKDGAPALARAAQPAGPA